MISNIDSKDSIANARAWWKELNGSFNGKFWSGQDWFVPRTTTIYEAARTPGNDGFQTIDLAYTRDSIHPELSPSLAQFMLASLRSRLGLFGIQLVSDLIIKDFAQDFETKKKASMDGARLIQKVPIINHSGRQLTLPEGFGVFKLYYPDAAERLFDEELEAMVKSSDGIVMAGIQREDWDFAFDKKGRRIGLKLNVDPSTYTYYPPSLKVDEDPIQLINGPGYRDEIMKAMIPYDKSKLAPYDHALWVCRSRKKMTIMEGCNAVVRRFVETELYDAYHTNAVAIYGGFDEGGVMRSNWPIQFECIASMKNLPKEFVLEVWRDRK